ncbi:armadillo repeat only 2 [Abeliophyllum distichum]|uniref:Armadillo repeat only 2 n=1 Tax=Abeliophyllum distichum TaxID=126358 RepID=A0ABD1RWW4_9LAMI
MKDSKVHDHIEEQITILYTGSLEDRSDAASTLVSLAQDNDQYRKLIIEEGGVGPPLKLVQKGKLEGQENAAKTIGHVGRDTESVEHLIHAGTCSVFSKILKERSIKVQAVVVWEHSKYAVVSKATSMHQVVVLASNNNANANANVGANKENDLDEDRSKIPHPFGNKQSLNRMYTVTNRMALKGQTNGLNQDNVAKSNGNNGAMLNSISNHQQSLLLSGASNKAREMEDTTTKTYMKAMVARALWRLAKGNSPICKSITESRGLLCFTVLLEKGSKDVQYNSTIALTEITVGYHSSSRGRC